jgi:hypothetical protein
MIASTGTRRIGMVSATAALLMILLAGTRSHAQAQSAPAAAEMGKLRLLYVGHPGSDREKDFVQFLGAHFATVKTGDLSAFKEKDAEGYDVTILDYDGDGFKAPHPRISPGFSKPLVTVGVAGGLMCDRCGLKTGYL